MLFEFVCVALGGSIGAMLRYGVGLLCAKANAASVFGVFPISTLIANFFGCFIIGLLSVYFESLGGSGANWKLFAVTGLLGGFTTFSTFSLETVSLWQQGDIGIAALNVVVSLALCFLGVVLGRLLATTLVAAN